MGFGRLGKRRERISTHPAAVGGAGDSQSRAPLREGRGLPLPEGLQLLCGSFGPQGPTPALPLSRSPPLLLGTLSALGFVHPSPSGPKPPVPGAFPGHTSCSPSTSQLTCPFRKGHPPPAPGSPPGLFPALCFVSLPTPPPPPCAGPGADSLHKVLTHSRCSVDVPG